MRVSKEAAVPLQISGVMISIGMVTIAMLVISIYLNFQNAINRGKQRRLMADIRTIAGVVESYYADFNVYPSGKTAVQDIAQELEPYLEKELPVKDE
jgi:hypothetical protein